MEKMKTAILKRFSPSSACYSWGFSVFSDHLTVPDFVLPERAILRDLIRWEPVCTDICKRNSLSHQQMKEKN